MQNIQRSIYGAYLQTCQFLGLSFSIKEHTTLNEKFDINPSISVPSGTIPTVKYLAIGNGGHTMAAGTDGVTIPKSYQHEPSDAALFNHLPFVLRLPAEDLSVSERTKYRLRRLETHNGTTYVAYYLKVIDTSSTVAEMEYKTVSAGQTTSSTFTPTTSNLSPTASVISSTGVATTTGDYLSATAKVAIEFTEDEVTELLNVAKILYGDEAYAIVSEMAYCSGVDKSVNGNFNGATVAYTDAIGVQVASFMSVFYPMQYSNTGLTLTVDVGAVESLLTSS